VRLFAFNGDADGLCALQQLHLVEGEEGGTAAPALITGPKRRTALLFSESGRDGYLLEGDARRRSLKTRRPQKARRPA